MSHEIKKPFEHMIASMRKPRLGRISGIFFISSSRNAFLELKHQEDWAYKKEEYKNAEQMLEGLAWGPIAERKR